MSPAFLRSPTAGNRVGAARALQPIMTSRQVMHAPALSGQPRQILTVRQSYGGHAEAGGRTNVKLNRMIHMSRSS
jgi:hypothetical protein